MSELTQHTKTEMGAFEMKETHVGDNASMSVRIHSANNWIIAVISNCYLHIISLVLHSHMLWHKQKLRNGNKSKQYLLEFLFGPMLSWGEMMIGARVR